MQIHPNRVAIGLATAGLGLLGCGAALSIPQVVNWGGSVLLGLVLARCATLLGVDRIRTAGFEMLWSTSERHRRIARADRVLITAEIRNRDSRAARFSGLRAVASPGLNVIIGADSGEVPANGRFKVEITVIGMRVGVHAIHGLSLEICAGPGLFEIPLTFANPFAIEVLPRAYAVLARNPRGGRSRSVADLGRPGPLSGDSTALRELREHQPGDPFKRIAWKASARRGVLLVKDYEREQRDLVWLVLDASVELWSGHEGTSPLDLAIDEVASVALEQLRRGNRVALTIVGARTLEQVEPGGGSEHALRILGALSHATGTLDADRSGLDEADVADRVLEHLRPIEPDATAHMSRHEVDEIAALAQSAIPRAPIPVRAPRANTDRERTLRQYMAAFGLDSPARLQPDRPITDHFLAELIRTLPLARHRPTQLWIWSIPPAQGTRPELERALLTRARRRVELLWIRMRHEPSIPSDGSPLIPAVAAAVSVRTRVAEARGTRFLRSRGIRVESPSRPPRRVPSALLAAESTSAKLAKP